MKTLSATLTANQKLFTRRQSYVVEYKLDGSTWTDITGDVRLIDYSLHTTLLIILFFILEVIFQRVHLYLISAIKITQHGITISKQTQKRGLNFRDKKKDMFRLKYLEKIERSCGE